KRASLSLNADRVPEITLLHDEAQIEEKGLKGKAAKFYRDTSQLFVNMRYPAVILMREQLETEYAAAPDPELMRRMAAEQAERTMVARVGRAVVFALAKQLAGQATRGFGLTKRAMNASFGNGLDAQLDLEAECMHEAGMTADYEEGVRAFLEKRKPVYQGK
ncbi:MAG: enoyl-CoA hydratase-related protein, partial [Gemmatimonas sp.]